MSDNDDSVVDRTQFQKLKGGRQEEDEASNKTDGPAKRQRIQWPKRRIGQLVPWQLCTGGHRDRAGRGRRCSFLESAVRSSS